VYEVGLDGEVVRLHDIDGPAKKRDQTKKDDVKPNVAAVPADTAAASNALDEAKPAVPDAATPASEPVKVVDKVRLSLHLVSSTLARTG